MYMEKPKILVVDDEEIVRLNIERILKSVHYHPVIAEGGQQAIQLLKEEEFDLVLADLIMEDLDGLEVLEASKRISPNTVVIIITGYGSLSSAVKAMQKGAYDYVLKPCDRGELLFRIRKGLDKRELERKLLETKRIEAVLSNIGIFTLNDKGVILSANSAMSRRIWGNDNIVGKTIYELTGSEKTGLREGFEKACLGQGVDRENIRFYSPHSRKDYILSSHFKPVTFRDGRVKTLVWILEDITHRIKVMQQISQAEKLAALGKLAAGVAHEINNPLNIISLDTEYLKGQLPPDSPLRESLVSINEEVDRIAHIVQQLQDQAKLEESSCESVRLQELLKSHIFAITFAQTAKKGIQLELKIEDGLPNVRITKTKITQVLMNMVNNAEEAMPSGGLLTISVRNLSPDRHGEENFFRSLGKIKGFVEILIRDTGSGIKKEDQNYLFEPFFTTKGFDGTGLGLFISYSIIKSYHGFIRVESQLGKGTDFYIILPLAAEENRREGERTQLMLN